MSIATHLVTVARSLSDILNDINLELLDKGSTAAATLDQVDEKIRAIEAGSISLPEILASDVRLSTSSNGTSTTSRLLNIENSSGSNKKFSSNQPIQKSVPNLTSSNIKYNTTIIDVQGSFTQVQSGETGASASDITKDKVAWVNGNKIVGTQEGSTISDLSDSDIKISGAIDSISITNDSGEDKKFSADQVVTASATGLRPANIAYGFNILGVDGSFTTVTSSQVPSASDITQGKVAYANGQRIEGTNTGGEILSEITDSDVSLSTSGVTSGSVKILNNSGSDKKFSSSNSSVTKSVSNLSSGNIKHGQTILGVTGSYPSGTMPTPITSNGSGINVQDYAYVNVNVPTGETLSEITASDISTSIGYSDVGGGSIDITNSSSSNKKFTSGTTKYISVPSLVAGNIKDGVHILNITGSFKSLMSCQPASSLSVIRYHGGSDSSSLTISAEVGGNTLFGVAVAHTSNIDFTSLSGGPYIMSVVFGKPTVENPSSNAYLTLFHHDPLFLSTSSNPGFSITYTSSDVTITIPSNYGQFDPDFNYYQAVALLGMN